MNRFSVKVVVMTQIESMTVQGKIPRQIEVYETPG
jgi:hypothetical protein